MNITTEAIVIVKNNKFASKIIAPFIGLIALSFSISATALKLDAKEPSQEPIIKEVASNEVTMASSVDEDKENTLSEKSKKNITSLTIDAIENYHFRVKKLNDELSEEIFLEYIKSYDPNHMYFLAGDFNEFSRYKNNFDDFLKNADLSIVSAIHRRFLERLVERITFAKSVLENDPDFSIDETFIIDREEEPWLTKENVDDEWRKKVKADFLALKLNDKSDEEIRESLLKRYETTQKRAEQINDIDVFQTFMNAYTSVIEPHTSYFSPRVSENFQIQMSLSLDGIGAVLQNDNEHTKVRSVVKGGPAQKSGQIRPGDLIVGVAQGLSGEMIDIVGWRVDDVVEKIRGERGTIVRLEIQPKIAEDGKTKEISIVRDKINLEDQAAHGKIIERKNADTGAIENIGVIELSTFYRDFQAERSGDKNFRSTTRDVRKIIAELKTNDIKGLVIDLRNNGGGSLVEANALTGLFIESGPIVQVLDSEGRNDIQNDPDPEILYDGPLMVMVNRSSASASEIFAAAIQDYKRGIIVGEPTYGKGTVQQLLDLTRLGRNFLFKQDEELGQLKMTVAQFFRINGGTTQYKGVVPDIVFPTAKDNIDYGERSIKNALPWVQIDALKYQEYSPAIEAKAIEKVYANHLTRIEDNAGFEYLVYEYRFIDEIQERKSLSLLLSKREELNKLKIEERLEKYNKFQVYIGKPELTKEEFLAEQEDDDISDEDEDENTDTVTVYTEVKEDVLLDETAYMLYDFINL